jgi:hypothetical protein
MNRISLSAVVVGCLLAAVVPPGEATTSDTGTAGGWTKYRNNPVLGGSLGTCFDVSVLREDGKYRMWFSWRPRQSIALVESTDGFAWGTPSIVLGPRKTSGWEEDVNRPVVIKQGGTYRMWYTGQARGKSWIGYATSADGKTWQRASDKPVLAAEQPWERVAVMCPHVLYDEKHKLYRMWYSGGEQNEPTQSAMRPAPTGSNGPGTRRTRSSARSPGTPGRRTG